MLTLNDGRNELWQWDTKRKLTVDAECSQVHFSNKVFGRSIDVDVVDGVAIVPDILLQTDKDLNVWAFVGTAENGYTKISKAFKVNRRNKPADYVFTPHDQTTLAEIMERLDELESIQDPDAIKNAVDDYLANNPIEVEETDPTVPDWAKQPEPPKVEIPEVNIPTTLPNPHPLTFTGAVTGTYDGSAPLTVEIPAGCGGGGNVVEILNLTITEETQYVFHPFSFELYDVVFMKIVQTENTQAFFSFNDDIIYFITSQSLHNHADLTIFQIDKERAFVVYNSGYVPANPNGVSNAAGNTFKGGMTFDPVKTGLKIFKASKWKTGDNIRIWGRLKA